MKKQRKNRTTKPDYTKLLILLIPMILACSAFLPLAQAVVPAPDGGYAGGNTAEGHAALFSLTSGAYNTAVGFLSLRSNTEGTFNTAIGAGTLLLNVGDPSVDEGIENTATGAGALLSNTTGAFNSAHGAFALFQHRRRFQYRQRRKRALNNIGGNGNTATGFRALYNNLTGADNTANGILRFMATPLEILTLPLVLMHF